MADLAETKGEETDPEKINSFKSCKLEDYKVVS